MSSAAGERQPGGDAEGEEQPNYPPAPAVEQEDPEEGREGAESVPRLGGFISRRPGARVRPAFPGDPGEASDGEEVEEVVIDRSTLSADTQILLAALEGIGRIVIEIETGQRLGVYEAILRIQGEATQIRTSTATITDDMVGLMNTLETIEATSNIHTLRLQDLVHLGEEALALYRQHLTPAVATNQSNQAVTPPGAVSYSVGTASQAVAFVLGRAGRGVRRIGNWIGDEAFAFLAVLLFLFVVSALKWHEWNQGPVNGN